MKPTIEECLATLQQAKDLFSTDPDIVIQTRSIPAEFAIHAWIAKVERLLKDGLN